MILVSFEFDKWRTSVLLLYFLLDFFSSALKRSTFCEMNSESDCEFEFTMTHLANITKTVVQINWRKSICIIIGRSSSDQDKKNAWWNIPCTYFRSMSLCYCTRCAQTIGTQAPVQFCFSYFFFKKKSTIANILYHFFLFAFLLFSISIFRELQTKK